MTKTKDELTKLELMLLDFAKVVAFKQMSANEHIKGFYQIDDKANIDVESYVKSLAESIEVESRRARKALLARVREEVIGYSEYGNIGYDGEDMVDDTTSEMLARNDLRAEQRKALNKLEKML